MASVAVVVAAEAAFLSIYRRLLCSSLYGTFVLIHDEPLADASAAEVVEVAISLVVVVVVVVKEKNGVQTYRPELP